MNARILLMAAFALLLALQSHAVRAGAAPERVLASWTLSFEVFDETDADRLTASGGILALTERSGRVNGPMTEASRYSVAFARIGCVTVSGDTVEIYPAVRWGVERKNLLTGKTSPESKVSMVFPNAARAQSALRLLEAQSPYVRKKIGACKSDVDLYGLKFGPVPEKTDPYSWTRNSELGATQYTLWVDAGVLYAEQSDAGIKRHAVKKVPLSHIHCVHLEPETHDLAAGIGLATALPHDVLSESSTDGGKSGTFTESSIMMSFDDDSTQQSAWEYLTGKDPALKGTVKPSCR